MAIFEIAKELILGTRLKRLSERFLNDVSIIYKEHGIDFEPSWFGIFFLLDRYDTLTVGEIAANLDITQSGASQVISQLEKKNLINITTGKSDKRKKVVSLTDDGMELLKKIKPVWKLMRAHMKEMLDEGENSRYMLDALFEIETTFKKSSLSERVIKSIHESKHSVSLFKEKHYHSLKKLIFHWIFNFYALPFINNLKETLEKNSDNIIIALKDREIIAAVVGIKENSRLNVVLCDREDVDNSVLVSIFDTYMKEKCQSINTVEFDSDKIGIIQILEKNSFIKYKEKYFEDSSKKLAVYRRS
jgi:DNA-binding MarR family transcriptional regulator